jgi:NAD(P)H dehydrogenase (quinone)
MTKILVTGASGDIGRKTLLHLMKKTSVSRLVGLVRDRSKANDLAALGIELRQGDYLDPTSLARAFTGVDKVMLTSTHAFTDRITAHQNAIDAAVDAGVQHAVYMPILRRKNSDLRMQEITDEDIFTEEKLRSSGLAYTFAYHPPFLDILGFYIGLNAHQTGVRVPAGDGKFAAATRNDLAAAHASILTGAGHENRSYSLTGDPSVSFADIAGILSKVTGTIVPYVPVSEDEYLTIIGKDVPKSIAVFVLEWVRNMSAGEWSDQTSDLEMLIGRRPKTPEEFFREDHLARF